MHPSLSNVFARASFIFGRKAVDTRVSIHDPHDIPFKKKTKAESVSLTANIQNQEPLGYLPEKLRELP